MEHFSGNTAWFGLDIKAAAAWRRSCYLAARRSDMIRTACAWVLLLLAASPVTAPFSTCDLRRFAGDTPIVQPAFAQFASISATESDDGDAYSLSPIVTRSVLRPDSPAGDATAARVLIPPDTGRLRAPRGLNRSPHELSASSMVLRL